MNVDSYEINTDTCAVMNLSEDASRVIEKENEYLLSKPTYEIMEDSCSYYGSTFEGRIKGTKKILGSNYKLPIIVEESNDIIFFPTGGATNEKCCWISLNNIDTYELYKGYTKVNFLNGKTIIVKVSFKSFEMQLLRACRLQALVKKRTKRED